MRQDACGRYPLLFNAMPISKIFAGIAVNFLVPLLGVIVFVLLCRRMLRANVPSPPFFCYFVLFATFGGWLMVFLTAMFWEWSGMASFGVFYLVLIAPFVTAGVAFSLHGRRAASVFHQSAYYAGIGYSGSMMVLVLVRIGVWFFARN
jgi:hypothetical protein